MRGCSLSGNGDETPASFMQRIPVVQRVPFEREQGLAAKRAELVAAGLPLDGFDAVLAELREQERQTLGGMARQAELVVSSFCTTHAEALALLPTAVSQGLIVRATVAYLYGYGVMVPAPADGEAAWHMLDWAVAVPEHLWPDVEQAMRGYSRMLGALHETHTRMRRGAGSTAESVPVGTPLYDPPPVERS